MNINELGAMAVSSQVESVRPKSFIFMKKYEDTDFPRDFLVIFYKIEA